MQVRMFRDKPIFALFVFFRDSIYMSASNMVKDRMTSDDLYVYNASDSSVTLAPSQDRKLVQCEIAGLIMLIFKGNIN